MQRFGTPTEPQEQGWPHILAGRTTLGIHIAERDTQRSSTPKPRGKFINTWSVEGFIAEGLQPSELGWNPTESMPPGAYHHDFGCEAAIYLSSPGAGTRVRSWTPTAQAQHGLPRTSSSLSPITSRCAITAR